MTDTVVFIVTSVCNWSIVRIKSKILCIDLQRDEASVPQCKEVIQPSTVFCYRRRSRGTSSLQRLNQ